MLVLPKSRPIYALIKLSASARIPILKKKQIHLKEMKMKKKNIKVLNVHVILMIPLFTHKNFYPQKTSPCHRILKLTR